MPPLRHHHGERESHDAHCNVDGVRRALGNTEGLHQGAVATVREQAPEEGVEREEGGGEETEDRHGGAL